MRSLRMLSPHPSKLHALAYALWSRVSMRRLRMYARIESVWGACVSSRLTLVASTHSRAYFLPPLAVCSFSIAATPSWPCSSASSRAVSPDCVCVCVCVCACVHNIYIYIHIYVYIYIIQTQHLNSALTHTHTLSRVCNIYIEHYSKYYYRTYYTMLRGSLYQLYMKASLVISIESN
jgi:hypothetical protein